MCCIIYIVVSILRGSVPIVSLTHSIKYLHLELINELNESNCSSLVWILAVLKNVECIAMRHPFFHSCSKTIGQDFIYSCSDQCQLALTFWGRKVNLSLNNVGNFKPTFGFQVMIFWSKKKKIFWSRYQNTLVYRKTCVYKTRSYVQETTSE